MDKAVSSLSGPVPPFTVRVMPGSPATELTHGAHDADLPVVGSSGRGGIGRLTLGSVTSQVAYEAPCLVVIIPSRCSPLPGPGHGVAAGGGAQLPVDRFGGVRTVCGSRNSPPAIWVNGTWVGSSIPAPAMSVTIRSARELEPGLDSQERDRIGQQARSR